MKFLHSPQVFSLQKQTVDFCSSSRVTSSLLVATLINALASQTVNLEGQPYL
ncbi:hypothetical protein ATANTOWER_032485, partial [Ataeniobius toweri]|nr:hypothetical protein [Ataeniobius toweri]